MSRDRADRDDPAATQGGPLMSIEVRNVSKRFGDFQALDDVSLDVDGGSLTALLGPSGSGKSTLLRIVAGLEWPDAGEMILEGEEATALTPQKRGVGFVFQHYAAFKHMTVRDNIAFGLKIRKRPAAEIRARVDELIGAGAAPGLRRPLSGAAVGRPAAAHGARTGARARAEGAPARRAVRRARRPRPRRAARSGCAVCTTRRTRRRCSSRTTRRRRWRSPTGSS